MGLGYVEGYTHDYCRHGTTTLFSALNVATGQVISRCKSAHRHERFISFLRQIDANTPPELDIHGIADNYATHKHPKVKVWLARHPRFHFHFTPTYSSWLNQVETFFGIIRMRAAPWFAGHRRRQWIARLDDVPEGALVRGLHWTSGRRLNRRSDFLQLGWLHHGGPER